MVDVEVMDGQELRYPSNFLDVSVTNFGIFFFPDPLLGAKEIYRTLKSGGFAVLTLWKDIVFKPMLWEVQRVIQPTNPITELHGMEKWFDGGLLMKTLQEGGFRSVELKEVTEAIWGNGEDYFRAVLIEEFEAMVVRNWTDEEKSQASSIHSPGSRRIRGEVLHQIRRQDRRANDRMGGCMQEMT